MHDMSITYTLSATQRIAEAASPTSSLPVRHAVSSQRHAKHWRQLLKPMIRLSHGSGLRLRVRVRVRVRVLP